jgi:preprotein translocase subunit YajC
MASSLESDYKYSAQGINKKTVYSLTILYKFTIHDGSLKIIISGGIIMTGVAYASGGAAGGAGGFASFIPLILIFAVFYFMLIRPQQKQAKQQQQFLNDLKNGYKVVTKGGIHGTITGLTDSVVTLEIADKIRVKVSRSAIGGPLTKESDSAPVKSSSS